MNWIQLNRAFYSRLNSSGLSTGQVALWFVLTLINNECVWREWFSVSNKILEIYTGMTRQGVAKCREVLKEQGYIDYRLNGLKATEYRIIDISFEADTQPYTQQDMQLNTQRNTQQDTQQNIIKSCTLNKQTINNKQTKTNITPIVPYEEMFSKLWEAYPRHDDRKRALSAFVKLKPTEELLTAIINAVEKQKVSEAWAKEDGKWIPMLSTYLNKERWKDEGIKDTRRIPQKGDKDWIPG